MSNIIDDIEYEAGASCSSIDDFFPILQYSSNASSNIYLKKAIQITNIFLKTDLCRDAFQMFKVNPTICKNMINTVEVCFSNKKDAKKDKIESNEENCTYLVWTDRKKDSSIHINNIFKERLDKTKNENEKKIIVVYISILIIHETAHLLFRWNDINDTPEIFTNAVGQTEAGDFLEERLFRFDICSFIKKSDENAEWDNDMQFLGKNMLVFLI